jgi:hypothetical protein
MDAQVAIYTVDPMGLVDHQMPDIALSGRGNDPGNRVVSARDRIVPPNLTSDPYRGVSADAARDTIIQLAEQTGGRAFYNRNDVADAILEGIDEGATYYTLTYYPVDRNWDGKFRKLEVRVARRDVQVYARTGYFATDRESVPDSEAEASQFIELLNPGTPRVTSLPFSVKVNPPKSGAQETVIEYAFNPFQLVLRTVNDNAQQASLQYVVRVFDLKGDLFTSDSRTVQMTLTQSQIKRIANYGHVGYSQRVKLPPGSYLLQLGIRDLRSNLMGTVSASINVPAN